MIKKILNGVFAFLLISFASAFSMASQDSEVVNAIVDSIEASNADPTISQLNKELDFCLNQIIRNNETESFLTVMSLRANLALQMLFESCVARSYMINGGLTDQEFKACCQLKNVLYDDSLNLYTQAEIAYSEASQLVQRAIDISEVLATNNQILALKSLEKVECEYSSKYSAQDVNRYYIENLFCYQKIRKLFPSRFLKKECPDKYKKFLFNKKSLEEIARIASIRDTFFVNDFYKTHLKLIYDYVYEAYFKSCNGSARNDIPETIFALDEAVNFNQHHGTQLKFCNISRLSRFCKVKDLLVAQKTTALKRESSSMKRKIHQNEITYLNKLKFNNQDHEFTQETCLSLIPELFSHFGKQAQKELNSLLTVDSQYKNCLVLGFTPLEAYFETIKIQGDGLLSLLELPSDLFCNYKKMILDGVECNKFITAIQDTINILVPPCVAQEAKQESKKPRKKRKKNHKKSTRNKNKFEQVSSDVEDEIAPKAQLVKESDSQDKEIQDVTDALSSMKLVDNEELCKNQYNQLIFSDQANEIVYEEVEQVPLDQDYVIAENEALICLLDCQRARNGGYQIEVFVYKNNGQVAINPIESLDYSVLKKINYSKDNNHAFTKLVEVYGVYGRTELIEQLTSEDPLYAQGYRVKCFFSIPGRLASIGYPIHRASESGPNGTFEFTVLKREVEDKGGICVHRFFRPNK